MFTSHLAMKMSPLPLSSDRQRQNLGRNRWSTQNRQRDKCCRVHPLPFHPGALDHSRVRRIVLPTGNSRSCRIAPRTHPSLRRSSKCLYLCSHRNQPSARKAGEIHLVIAHANGVTIILPRAADRESPAILATGVGPDNKNICRTGACYTAPVEIERVGENAGDVDVACGVERKVERLVIARAAEPVAQRYSPLVCTWRRTMRPPTLFNIAVPVPGSKSTTAEKYPAR